MSRRIPIWLVCVLLATPPVCALAQSGASALVGTWHGKATGPDGGPPTGDIVVTFERDKDGIKGKVVVKAPNGVEYSGKVFDVALKKQVFSATATFNLGENPLEVAISGPLKEKTIEGTFSVTSKGDLMGDGSFSIKKGPAPAPGK